MTEQTPVELDDKLKKLAKRRVKRGADLLRELDGTLEYVKNIGDMDNPFCCVLAERARFHGRATNYWTERDKSLDFTENKAISHGFTAPDGLYDPKTDDKREEDAYFALIREEWLKQASNGE